MRLAIVDNEGTVLLTWPTAAEAHADIADQLAAAVHPKRKRRRAKLAGQVRQHLLELQQHTIRL